MNLAEVGNYFLKAETNVPLSNVILNAEQDKIIKQFLHGIKNRDALRKYKIKVSNTILLWGFAGGGKFQSLTSKILTPKGWTTMGKVKVGETIFDGNGKKTKVVKLFPQGKKDIYKIEFNDGTFIEVGAEHLNIFYQTRVLHKHKVKGKVVSRESGKKYYVMTTLELIKFFNEQKKNTRMKPLRVDLPIPEFDKQKVKIPPYILGLLLGDGGIKGTNRCLSFTNEEYDIIKAIEQYTKSEKDNFIFRYDERRKDHQCQYNIYGNHIVKKLKEYKLYGTESYTKFIPKEYLYNDFETRLKVVQGLMDTDGYVKNEKTEKGYIRCGYEYTTVSKQLSEDFAFLVRSLGCVDTVIEKQGAYTLNGEKHICKKYYRHTIKVPNGLKIVSSEKHLAKIKDRQLDEPVKKIIAIKKYKKNVECQCLMVKSNAHTYITDNITPTHNTYTVTALATELKMPLYILDVGGVLQGESPLRNIKEVFEFVTDPANQPCILFMDECDSIVISREKNDVNQNQRMAVNLVLQEINEENRRLKSNLIIFSATNLIDQIDDAFKSRFGLQIEYPMPDDYREQTKRIMKKKSSNDNDVGFEMFELIDDVDEEEMRIINREARTQNFSTRTLEKKIQEECEYLANEDIDAGKPVQVIPIKLSGIMKRVCQHINLGLKVSSLSEKEKEAQLQEIEEEKQRKGGK